MDAHARKMIYIPSNKNNKEQIVYIFLHGAFCNPWSWSYIADELHDKGGYMCILYYLKDYEEIVNTISTLIPNTYTIRLVGFSIGSLLALSLSKKLLNTHKVELFLISTPLMNSLILVKVRIKLAKFLNIIFFNVDRRFIPLFLRGKFKIDESIFLLDLIQLDYQELISSVKGCLQVNVYSGKFDFISGNIKKQKEFCKLFSEYGIKSTFISAGITGHFPYLINRKAMVDWLLKNNSYN
jgi:hypothetical protein